MQELAVVLNGPPGVGKHTLASLLGPHGFEHLRFKDRLFEDTIAFFDLQRQRQAEEFRRRAADRILKEQPWAPLCLNDEPYGQQPLTPRRALTHVSENILKPRYGRHYFGEAVTQACRVQGIQRAVFSDGGFLEEVQCLSTLFDIVCVFRLIRDGVDWDNDSCRYLKSAPIIHDLQLIPDKPEHAVLQILQTIPLPGKQNEEHAA